VEPVLETSGSTHERFLRQYVGKTEEALTIYYRSLVFAGKTLFPKRFKSDEEVVRYVARTKGAIGYVNSATDTSGTKTLKVQ
jgi:ABC-type phosphate transport system substrate-binding protein